MENEREQRLALGMAICLATTLMILGFPDKQWMIDFCFLPVGSYAVGLSLILQAQWTNSPPHE
jgi:hypothetical protein